MNSTHFGRILLHAISFALLGSPFSNGQSKVLEYGYGALEINAGIGDRHTTLETTRTLWWYLLVALVDVGLDHHANNAGLTFADLSGNVLGDEWLVSVVLIGVSYSTLVIV